MKNKNPPRKLDKCFFLYEKWHLGIYTPAELEISPEIPEYNIPLSTLPLQKL